MRGTPQRLAWEDNTLRFPPAPILHGLPPLSIPSLAKSKHLQEFDNPFLLPPPGLDIFIHLYQAHTVYLHTMLSNISTLLSSESFNSSI